MKNSVEPFLCAVGIDPSVMNLLINHRVIRAKDIKNYLSDPLVDAGYKIVNCRLRKVALKHEYQMAYRFYYKNFYDGEPEPGSQERLDVQPFMQQNEMHLCWLLKLEENGKLYYGFYYPFSEDNILYVVPEEVVEVESSHWQLFCKHNLRVEKSFSGTILTYRVWLNILNCLWDTNFTHQQCLWNK